MTTEMQRSNRRVAIMRPVMPPYCVLQGFLDEPTVAGLFEYTLAHERAFTATGVGRLDAQRIDPAIRVSLATRDLGPYKQTFKSRMRGLTSDIIAKLRVTPVESPSFELQLVAHNDGAFFKSHIDTQTASDTRSVRVLSGVYYFHSEPKAFSGGALRLYALGDPASSKFVDIEPTHNSLLVFPSWVRHEVMPVICPSKRFADSRFAVNCWVHRKNNEAAT